MRQRCPGWYKAVAYENSEDHFMRQINLEHVEVCFSHSSIQKIAQELVDGVLEIVIVLGKLEMFYNSIV